MSKFNSDKMGTMPVGKLLFSMSVPAIFSMLVQSLYNVVDSIFVAQVSEDALVAVSIAFPLQMLIIALALGVGNGGRKKLIHREYSFGYDVVSLSIHARDPKGERKFAEI